MKHFRAPIYDAIRSKSPFEGLWSHAAKVKECLDALEVCTAAFIAGEPCKDLAQTVSAIELEADEIKSNVRNHMPGNLRMPVDKNLFLAAMTEQDNICDEAEDAAIWMSMRQTAMPDDVAADMKLLLAKVVETVDAYERAVANIHDLVETGFVKKERDQEKELIHTVHQLEHETDVISRELSGKLLAPETEAKLGGVAVYHLLKLTLQISKIADHAENAGDRLRAMLSQ